MADIDMRFLPVSSGALLVELADLEQTLALFEALQADPVPGVAEIVPAARTLLVRTAPATLADAALAEAIHARRPASGDRRAQSCEKTIELAVHYDGEDLEEVARLMQLSTAEVIRAHQAAVWQVAFCGFAPGFAYMTCDDERFDLPRRSSPRTRIPAGSVALASRFCGIYPQDSPGGWQLIGRTDVPMWDLSRDPAALLRPGLRVRFVESRLKNDASSAPPAAAEAHERTALELLSSAFPLLYQDDGRPGQTAQGVSGSGALDRAALHRANRAVGNAPGAAALEITLGPVRLRARARLTLALSGAAGAATVIAGATRIPVTPGAAFALDEGDELEIAPPERGMRSYLAMRGGYQVAAVLGSASSDTLANVGPPALSAGARLATADNPVLAVGAPEFQPQLPKAGELIELPVTLGPRTDWFSDEMVQRFLTQEWLVTPQSSRVGIRLEGELPLERPDARELASEGTETGAIQIPHSGQPVLFLADHPLTGGYPVIATLEPKVLDLAGQIPPGARIRFTTKAAFTPIYINTKKTP